MFMLYKKSPKHSTATKSLDLNTLLLLSVASGTLYKITEYAWKKNLYAGLRGNKTEAK